MSTPIPDLSDDMIKDARHAIISDYHGKTHPHHISEALNEFDAHIKSSAVGGKCVVVGAIIYSKVTLILYNGHEFSGNGYGFAFPGAGIVFGQLKASNLTTLYREAHAFSYHATPVAVIVNFYSASSVLLGTFIGGGVNVSSGHTAGSGSLT